MGNRRVIYQDWGLIDYKEAWIKQEAIFASLVDQKVARQKDGQSIDSPSITRTLSKVSNHLVFCQHPNVITLGKSGNQSHLLLDEMGLKRREIEYYPANRGGDITYHGPGQLLCYPILDLDFFFTDLHRYMRTLEEAVIRTLIEYGLTAGRYKGFTGVWFDGGTENARKIAAMGVRCSKWIVMHGLSFNINTDLSFFDDIIPCGIHDKKVTSMEVELGYKTDIQEVQGVLSKHMAELFGMTYV